MFTCLLCKEKQQQPITQVHTVEIQTREASEETEGHLVEMTIQTDTNMVTEAQTDLSEALGKTGTSLMGQDEGVPEANMDLGKCP